MLAVGSSDGCIPGPVLSPLYREQLPLRGLPRSQPRTRPQPTIACTLGGRCLSSKGLFNLPSPIMPVSRHCENASLPQNICVCMNLSPCSSVLQTAMNLDVSCPAALLIFRGPLYHVFLTSLAFCTLPRSLTCVLGCGTGWEATKEMSAASAISTGKNFGGRLQAFH